MSDAAWAAVGVIVTQLVTLVVALATRKKVSHVEKLVNGNSERLENKLQAQEILIGQLLSKVPARAPELPLLQEGGRGG